MAWGDDLIPTSGSFPIPDIVNRPILITMNPPIRTWREIEQIPGIIPVSALEISSSTGPVAPSQYEGDDVAIRWKKMSGLEWFAYRIIKVARVYGETHLL